MLENGISILDISHFVDPDRFFDTTIADYPKDVTQPANGEDETAAEAKRHDLQPGDPFSLGADINILDLAMMIEVNPPPAMLGVNRVFDTTCP